MDSTITFLSDRYGYEKYYIYGYDNTISSSSTYFYFGPFGIQRIYGIEIFLFIFISAMLTWAIIAFCKNKRYTAKFAKRKKVIFVCLGIVLISVFSYCCYVSSKIDGEWVSEDGKFKIDFKSQMSIEYMELVYSYIATPGNIMLIRKNTFSPKEWYSVKFIDDNKIQYRYAQCGNVPCLILTRAGE